VRKLQNQLQIIDSITTINKEHDIQAVQKRINVPSLYSEVAPVVIRKLKAKNGDLTKLTKKEILAILFFVFHTLEDDKKNKDVIVAVLSHHAIKAKQSSHACVWCRSLLKQQNGVQMNCHFPGRRHGSISISANV
jgi:hypothetical protein